MEDIFKPVLEQNPFPQRILGFTYPYSDDIPFFIKECYKIKSNHSNEASPYFKDNLYGSPRNLFELYPQFDKLKQYIEKIVDINYNVKSYVDDSWLNIYSKGGYNSFHSHHPYFLAGVFFLQVPLNHQGLNFHNRFDPNNIHTISPPGGSILIFDGDQSHSSYPNTSNENKISIAFNLKKVE